MLLRLNVQHSLGFEEDTVLEVDDNPVEAARLWAAAIIKRLRDRSQAFKEASILRDRFQALVTWDAAIKGFSSKIRGILSQ
jgi:hypothetical protein